MFNRSLFSSSYFKWRTPKALYKVLNREFHFTFDPCPSKPKFNGLLRKWCKRNFVNPPYGRNKQTGIAAWIKKGAEESQKGKLVVFLIPSRTDTAWWHDYVMKADEIRFIRGRLKFQGAKNSAPFPSCIEVFKGTAKRIVKH